MDKTLMKDTFNDLFNSSGFDIPDKIEADESVKNDLTKEKKSLPVNYNTKRNSFYEKAKKTIDSLLTFYYQTDIISEDEYIKQKTIQDQQTLGDIMNQIEISNRAINTLMENIDMGDIQPRLFEVLSDAQRTFIELLKMKSMHLIQVEESVKKLMVDKDIYSRKELSEDNTQVSHQTITSRGSKKLMKDIQDAIKNQEVEDI